jgi:hypothetical protein
MKVMNDDLKKWNENFNKQFLFKKAVLTWNEAKGLARVHGYLVGEEELDLLGIWKTSGSFFDLTYQCAIDPFVNPGAGCKAPQHKGYVKGGSCAVGLNAVCPAFSGLVLKAQAEALIKKHAGENPKPAPALPRPAAPARSPAGRR